MKVKSKRPAGRVSSSGSGFPRDVRGNDVSRISLIAVTGRIGGIEQLEEFDELKRCGGDL